MVRLKRTDICLRDPFVLPVPEEKSYYLFGTSGFHGIGFDCWRSPDLEEFEPLRPAYTPDADLEDSECFWAPEVVRRDGRFYLFATFRKPGHCRECRLLSADAPQGPYRTCSDGGITPPDWMCLDGTLYVDRKGKPYLVFCHEWLQAGDGAIHALPLSDDWKTPAGKPFLLFHGSDAPWAVPLRGTGSDRNYVTDGPFLFESEGRLRMLWSGFSSGQTYVTGMAESVSGELAGPWIQFREPVVTGDGGHAMLFRTFDGRRMLAFHSPNSSGGERPCFIPF